MEPRPHHIPPQTSKQAKAAFKKHGFRLSTREIREIERAEELQRRADRIKEQERRKKLAQKRKAEKEQREREARTKLGVGLATQLAGYSHSQVRMKNGMESFLRTGRVWDGFGKDMGEGKEVVQVLTDEEEEGKEPRDESSAIQTDISRHEYSKGANRNQWSQDGLDDGTLLEAQSRAVSEPWDIEDVDDETFMDAIQDDASLHKQHTPKPLRQPDPEPETSSAQRREDSNFVRLHGPIDAALEKLLDSLPDRLIELFSQDVSSNPNSWNPAPSLLHRLKPPGLPPHRLRIKVGCTVILLTNLNSNIQTSERSHLRILRITNERLECMVLDGQLEGTKSILTRVPFSARYRNEDRYSFIRSQFPVRVSTDSFQLQEKPAIAMNNHKRPHAIHDNLENMPDPKKPKVPEPFTKPPVLPSRVSKSSKAPKFQNMEPKMIDFWDNFLASGTQIARELSPDPDPIVRKPIVELSGFMLCTQDLDFSAEDLEELESSNIKDVPQIPLDTVPKIVQPRPLQINVNRPTSKLPKYQGSAPVTSDTVHQKLAPAKADANKEMMLPPPPPHCRLTKPVAKPKITLPPHQSIQPIRSSEQSVTPSLKDFGISTQDLASIIEDDLPLSSPPIPT